MSRNGSGQYVPPASTWNPATPDTVILSDDWNTLLADMAVALTQSIASDGQTPTAAIIPFTQGISIAQGSVTVPSLSVIGDVDTGFYSPAANQIALATGGVAGALFTSTGLTVPIALTVGGNASIAGALGVTGLSTFENVTINGALTITDPITTATIATLTVTTAITVPDASFTNAKLANMATATLKGRTTAGTGAPEDLTATQATALINAMVGDSGSGGTKGLVPAPATGDAVKYLRGDATWASPIYAQGVFTGSTGATVKARGVTCVRNALGDYTFTFSPALPDSDYIMIPSFQDVSIVTYTVQTKNTTTLRITTINPPSTALDPAQVLITIIA